MFQHQFPGRVLTAVTIWLVAISTAAAQYAPGMSGRSNDASNQVGSGGINRPTQSSYFNTANLYVTGNVSGGRSFRGYSPIRDPSSIMLSLPSQNIDSFRSDAVGLDQVSGSQPLLRYSPFFSPSGSVTSANAINAGLNQPGSSIPLTTSTIPFGTTINSPGLPATTDLRYGSLPNNAVAPNSSIYTPQNLPLLREFYDYGPDTMDPAIRALRASPLFSPSANTTSPLRQQYSSLAGIEDPYSLTTPANELTRTQPYQLFGSPIAETSDAPSSEDMLITSPLLVSPTQIAPKLFDRDRSRTSLADRDPLTGRPLPEPPSYLATPEDVAYDPLAARDLPTRTAQADLAAGSGTYAIDGSDYRYAEEPIYPGLAEAVQTVADVDLSMIESGELSQTPELRQRYERAMAYVHRVSSTPTETFTGDTSSRVGKLIARAEELVRNGDYYQASTVYSLASATAPGDALIKLGQGHALLAAGEYLSAVTSLTAAIEAYPAVAFMNFNLYAFVPDPSVLEIRRADLEDRLSRQEDYRLRFLLGYAEYFSGLQKFGLPDLERAAANAPADSVIAEFPDMLKNAERVKAAAEAKTGGVRQSDAEQEAPPASDNGE